MRRFFMLTEDSRQRGVHALVPNYPVFDVYFEYYQVSKCQRLPDDFLMAAQLLEKPGKKVDLVGNPMGWPIVSPELLALFQESAIDNIQVLRMNVVDSSGVPALTNYSVVNVLRCLDKTVDLDRSVISRQRTGDKETLNIITPVFRLNEVPRNTHFFRPSESMSHLIVSQEFGEAISNAKMKGFALIETGSV
jgi:hypothetical protein